MNKLIIILATLLAGLTACGSSGSNDDPAPTVSLTVSPTTVSAGFEASEATVAVSCSSEWTAYSADTWVTVAIDRTASQVTLKIAANPNEEARSTTVTIKSGLTLAEVAVSQEAKPAEEVDETITVPEGYELVWHDEFDTDGSPSTDWTYETGAGGWGNNELQNYVKIKAPDGTAMAEVKDGILNIKCDKINGTVYSIRMNTSKSWTYGYFEARLKLPTGKGTWPAFWMMPKNFTTWPGDGEIDIMEEVGYNPNYVSSSIHCNAYNHTKGTQKTKETKVATAQTDFHIYALEWTKDQITTYIDGKKLFSFDNDGTGNYDTWPFYTPFYLKLNLAWGGDWGGAQGVDESCLPAIYQVDYVRVFQKK
ncbi:MAG: family 16 glycosylhydrolase [Bacteroidales bacterium]|nr:family 16 glycosylhydrolase [Bacteroidales bacterium]